MLEPRALIQILTRAPFLVRSDQSAKFVLDPAMLQGRAEEPARSNSPTTSTPASVPTAQGPGFATLQYQLELTELLMDELREGVTVRDAVLADAEWMTIIFNVIVLSTVKQHLFTIVSQDVIDTSLAIIKVC